MRAGRKDLEVKFSVEACPPYKGKHQGTSHGCIYHAPCFAATTAIPWLRLASVR